MQRHEDTTYKKNWALDVRPPSEKLWIRFEKETYFQRFFRGTRTEETPNIYNAWGRNYSNTLPKM